MGSTQRQYDYEIQRLVRRMQELEAWQTEARWALEAANEIGQREGCHLNYSNHDRLLRAALQGGQETKTL